MRSWIGRSPDCFMSTGLHSWIRLKPDCFARLVRNSQFGWLIAYTSWRFYLRRCNFHRSSYRLCVDWSFDRLVKKWFSARVTISFWLKNFHLPALQAQFSQFLTVSAFLHCRVFEWSCTLLATRFRNFRIIYAVFAVFLRMDTLIWREFLLTEFTGWHQELTLSAVVTYGLPTFAFS